MRILPAAGRQAMPWKNGGGVTTEIATSPENAGLDDFEWRLSMAQVESGGPFSVFAGIDRTLAVLAGEGLVLTLEQRAPVQLTAADGPLGFPGDVPTRAELLGGAVLDLNAMSRRGRFTHELARHLTDAPLVLPLRAEATLVLARGEGLVVSCARGIAVLGDGDAAMLSIDDGDAEIRPPPASDRVGPAEFFVATFRRVRH